MNVSVTTNILGRCKTWLRSFVSRSELHDGEPRLETVRRKAPHTRGAVIFLHKGLGDLVLALPALRALNELGPMRLFLENERFLALLERHGIPRSKVYSRKSLRAWWAVLIGSYDYCVNFDSVHICYPSRILMLLAHATVNVGYNSGPWERLIQVHPKEPARHLFVGQVFDNLARCLGGEPRPAAERSRTNGQGPVVLHIGGRLDQTGFDKRWPVEKYVQLAERCAVSGHSVKILWGPGDPKPEATSHVDVEYCDSTESLFRAIGEARLFICNNTGVLWVACMMGVETISFATPFFLPSWDPREYRRETNHVLLGDRCCECTDYHCKRGNCIHEIGVETVLQLVVSKLATPNGCGKRMASPTSGPCGACES